MRRIKRLAKRLLRDKAEREQPGPSLDKTYNKLTREYYRALKHSDETVVCGKRSGR